MALLTTITHGCYSPELVDCTLTCSAPSDCADGQVCGRDKLCAAPEIAGHCAALPDDVALTISIDGRGRVIVQGVGTCEQSSPQNGYCMYLAPIDMTVTVHAQPYSDQRFDKWTTPPCAAVAISTCTFTAITSTTIGVKFDKHD